jgi:large subunit ribosomal protein L24
MARHVKKGDVVKVIAGSARGKTGTVIRVVVDKTNPENTRVVVEGVNRVWKHVKPTRAGQQGGKIQKDAPIHISNVLPVDPATGKATRVRFKVEGDKKLRVAVKGGSTLSVLRK